MIAIQLIVLFYVAITGGSTADRQVYKLLVIFTMIDIIVIGLIEIFDDIRSAKTIYIGDYITTRFKYWEQIHAIGIAKLKQRYTGTALGWAWAVLRPAMTIFVFWFAITLGLRSGGNVGKYPYFLWLISGFVPWFYMRDMISSGAACIRSNYHLLKVAKFPIITIPTITSVSQFPVHLVLIIVTIAIYIVSGFPPDVYMIQLPFYMFLMVVFFDFWSLFSGFLSTISRDFMNLVNAVTTVIFWLSGIIYNVGDLENAWLRLLLSLNPITIIVAGYRHCFIDKIWFFEAPQEMINYIMVLGVMIILSAKAYKKFGKILPDML